MTTDEQVFCETHGFQQESFVCQHIVESLHTGTPVGFHWSSESDSLHPDAWCSGCETARVAAGGDWTPEVEEVLDIQLLCAACYERAKDIWGSRLPRPK
jgi:hypothetical protein